MCLTWSQILCHECNVTALSELRRLEIVTLWIALVSGFLTLQSSTVSPVEEMLQTSKVTMSLLRVSMS